VIELERDQLEAAIALALAVLHKRGLTRTEANASILATASSCASLGISPDDLLEECALFDVLESVRAAVPAAERISSNVDCVAVFDMRDPISDQWLRIGRLAAGFWKSI
jgi:hypothetical protein